MRTAIVVLLLATVATAQGQLPSGKGVQIKEGRSAAMFGATPWGPFCRYDADNDTEGHIHTSLHPFTYDAGIWDSELGAYVESGPPREALVFLANGEFHLYIWDPEAAAGHGAWEISGGGYYSNIPTPNH